jgi:D-glycero-D-manno-heptose 1,7-bisphosphate phosphatase
MTLRPAVFLDRDGTLNAPVVREGKPYPPSNVDEFVLIEGVAENCAKLQAAGYVLVVATNQPDVGRGTQTRESVEAMHAKLIQLVPSITRIEVCYASGGETPPSPERKPAPGMVLNAARELGLELARSWMIGDRWRDIDCGHNAGLRTIFINWGYDEKLRAQPDFIVQTFPDAAEIVLAQVNS